MGETGAGGSRARAVGLLVLGAALAVAVAVLVGELVAGLLGGGSVGSDGGRLASEVTTGLLVAVAGGVAFGRRALFAHAGEEAINRMLKMFFQFIEGLPNAVFVVDARGRPLYANHAAKDLLGQGALPDTDPGQLARTYQAYIRGTDELYPAARMPILRALNGERGASVDDMEIRRDGRRIPIKVWANPLLDERGRVRYAIAAFVEHRAGPVVRGRP